MTRELLEMRYGLPLPEGALAAVPAHLQGRLHRLILAALAAMAPADRESLMAHMALHGYDAHVIRHSDGLATLTVAGRMVALLPWSLITDPGAAFRPQPVIPVPDSPAGLFGQ